jgi:hypothetical protein
MQDYSRLKPNVMKLSEALLPDGSADNKNFLSPCSGFKGNQTAINLNWLPGVDKMLTTGVTRLLMII